MKTLIDLKREYYSRPDMYFTPSMIDSLVKEYGDKPATMGEAAYVARYHLMQILSHLPIIGHLFRKEGDE